MISQDEQVHPHTMDQGQKTLKDMALKAYLPNQSHTPIIINHLRLRICNTNFSIWIKLKRGMLYHGTT